MKIRKGIYLFGFALLCWGILWGSNKLIKQDAIVSKAPLPTVSGLRQYTDDVQDVYLPLSGERQRIGNPVLAQHSATPAAQGQVISAVRPAALHSYGGGASSASMGNAVTNSAHSAQLAMATIAVPQVSHRSMVRNATQRPVASARRSAPRSAMKAQPMGRALPTTTAASDLSLGYEAASAYINHSPMRKPPVNNEGGSWYEWLQEMNGDNPYVDMETLYDKWLSQQENTNMPGNGTWEEFEAWFESDANTYYRLPIGDGAIWLILLASLYILIIYMKNKTHKPIELQ